MGTPQRHYAHLGPSTQGLLDPQALLEAIGLQPGETLLDAGSGEGTFTLPAAQVAGRVYALDVQPERIAAVQARARARGLANVEACPADLAGPVPLPAGSVDRCLLANVLHELAENGVAAPALQELARVLRRGGTLAVVDFRPELAPPPGPPQAVRLAPEQVVEMARPWGLREAHRALLGSYHYVLRLIKEI